MEIKYPDYKESIVNLACSVMNHYGVEPTHKTLEVFDQYLKKNYKNVVVILLDGLSVKALETHLNEESFLRRHFVKGISSVFPPTTTAATTSIESGLMPNEHGWLGWNLYFSEIDKIVNVFINTTAGTQEQAEEYHVGERFIPYENIFTRINKRGKASAYSVSPFGTNKVSSHEELFQEVERLCGLEGEKYIYGYSPQPDSDMHKYGCESKEASLWIEKLNHGLEAMCENLEDSIVIITADHGHIDIKYRFVSDYPEFSKMLLRGSSIEHRATCFHVKEEYLGVFKDEFYKTFGDGFILLSKEEVLEKKLFGEGKNHEKFEGFIGDFLSVAIGEEGIAYMPPKNPFRSNHAGLTMQEMMIPFIVVEKK